MKYIYTIGELKDYIEKGNIVIYGAGDWGKRLADYVISANLQDKIIGMVVSNMEQPYCRYRDFQIYEADGFLRERQCSVIIAVSWRYQGEVTQVVERYGIEYCIFSQDIYWELEEAMDTRKRVPYKGIDFLVPGFTKCGTTSLHKALITINDLYLAKQKESHLFKWYHKIQNPEKVLIENYFNDIREGQIVGMIEPTFETHAKEVYDFFGSDIKLIFLMRNPVESAFSRFKMMLRGGKGVEELYQKYGKFSLQMFDEYVGWNEEKNQGVIISRYIDWIDKFKEYYPADQIKLVYFEELVSSPAKVINQILNFIGSRCEYADEKLPLVNEGNYVMADLENYKIAREHNKLSWEYKECYEKDLVKKDEYYSKLMQSQREFEKTEKIYNVHISEEQRKKMEQYYNKSVRRLEEYSRKDLSELWF